MKNNINSLKLTDIGDLSRGKSKHRPRNDKSLYGGKYPFIQTGDIKKANHILQTYSQTYNDKGLSQSKLWKKGTICITIAANIADSAILGFDACFPDSVLGLVVDKDKANIDFVEYLLQYYKMNIKNQSNGTSQENINLDTFQQVFFDIPDLPIQNKIANVLSAIDRKIDINNKINIELEQTAKDLYDYWFVQFNFPDENKRPYKSNNGKMIYNETLKKNIPYGWEVKKIKDFCDVITGKEDANFAKDNGQYAFFTCGEEILRCNTPMFEGKAILIAGNGNFNVKYYEGKFNAYQRTYVLIPQDEDTLGIIYRSAIDNINRFIKGSNGSIVKFITKSDIENINLLIPNNKNLMIIFSKNLSNIAKLKEENEKLKYLRDWLLTMLMNGQVKVLD